MDAMKFALHASEKMREVTNQITPTASTAPTAAPMRSAHSLSPRVFRCRSLTWAGVLVVLLTTSCHKQDLAVKPYLFVLRMSYLIALLLLALAEHLDVAATGEGKL
jgi:hypothetical protein